MGDVNGKCKSCEGKNVPHHGNSEIWDPRDVKAVSKPDAKKTNFQAHGGLIKLNIGDMVVKIKKLKKKSNFEVSSPLGVGGIRG